LFLTGRLLVVAMVVVVLEEEALAAAETAVAEVMAAAVTAEAMAVAMEAAVMVAEKEEVTAVAMVVVAMVVAWTAMVTAMLFSISLARAPLICERQHCVWMETMLATSRDLEDFVDFDSVRAKLWLFETMPFHNQDPTPRPVCNPTDCCAIFFVYFGRKHD
jgi:hypothetical protein